MERGYVAGLEDRGTSKSQGLRAASRSWKCKETHSPRASLGSGPANTLILAPGDPVADSRRTVDASVLF